MSEEKFRLQLKTVQVKGIPMCILVMEAYARVEAAKRVETVQVATKNLQYSLLTKWP